MDVLNAFLHENVENKCIRPCVKVILIMELKLIQIVVPLLAQIGGVLKCVN